MRSKATGRVAKPVAKRSGPKLWISVSATGGASENPLARIIVMIWWTKIAWLSQIRAARRRAA
jgi:hypothetical protein